MVTGNPIPHICYECTGSEEAITGASLCPLHAAAPELLEALIKLTDACEILMQTMVSVERTGTASYLANIIKPARAAIAKATGNK